MTAPVAPSEHTVRTLLFGSRPEDARIAVSTAMTKHDVLGAFQLLSPQTQEAAISQLAVVASRLIDVNVGGLLLDGWRLHKKLIAAAAETLQSPGRRESVPLKEHEIEATRRPTVNVLIGRKRLFTVHFRAVVRFVLATTAAVENGALVEVGGGDAAISASFVVEVPARDDVEIFSRDEHFAVRSLVRLGGGVPLIVVRPDEVPA